MEYPGIVTVGSISQPIKVLENYIVHEIAHQWFYGVIKYSYPIIRDNCVFLTIYQGD